MSKSRDIADSAATINYIDNVTSDVQSQINTLDTALDNISVTSGTLTKTFTASESSTISLTSSVLAPVVSVTKEVPQSGVTNNSWDVNSTTENYTRLDSAYATTLDFYNGPLSSAAYVNVVATITEASDLTAFEISSDGTKMFVLSTNTDRVYQYSLATAYDISTLSYDNVSFYIGAQELSASGLRFNNDGTKMFIVGYGQNTVFEYALSSGFNLSTASYTQSFSVAAQANFATSLDFNEDGTKMWVLNYIGTYAYQYSLSTGFDVSTASYDSTGTNVGGTGPYSFTWSNNGTTLTVVSTGNNYINQRVYSTPYDFSTYVSGSSLLVSGQTTLEQSIVFTAGKLYVLTTTGGIYEYSLSQSFVLGTGSFASADVGKTIEANDGVFVLTATDGSYVETTAPTSYDQVASGSWEMYGVVYNAADGDLEISSYSDGFDLSVASYSQSFSVAAQEVAPREVTFNADGTKMFIVGTDNDFVYEYTLSTGFNVSTATYSQNFSVAAQETFPQGLAFNTDGTKMFIVGTVGDDVNEYVLSTGFDVSTASYSKNFSVASQDTAPQGLAFNTDGTKMFIVGSVGDAVYEYTLSTGFDVSTATYYQNFSLSTQDTSPNSVTFNSDGTKMFVVGTTNDSVYEYALSTAWDVSTASYSQSFSVASQETDPAGLAFNSDGTKMFVIGLVGDSVYEYTVGAVGTVITTGYHPVHTTASIDSTYWTDINSMTADQAAGDGNVYYAISTDDRTTWTVIDNTDGERDIVRNNAGTWQYNSNGTYASETWTNATTNTELAALAEAMEGAVGATINTYDVSTAVYSQSLSVASQETTPQGITFTPDGTKMFIVGEQGKDVNQYTLSTAFDISTASFGGSVSVSSREQFPVGVAFNPDGTKMFVVGWYDKEVNEFSLGTAFDVGTASWVRLFSVSAQDTSPQDLAFNADGTKMFIIGNANNNVYEYNLSTGFNVSTASYSQSFSVSDDQPNGLTFNNDGTKMFVVGATNDLVYEYSLSTAFDVSTASFFQSFSVLSEDGYSGALAFNSDGTKMFVVGLINDAVNEYNIGTPSYINQMDKTQLDAVTDPNHIALGNDLDLAIVFNMTSGTTVPSSDGVAINYDANVLNKGAVLGTDYDFDAPTQNSVRITALAANNLKVRVV